MNPSLYTLTNGTSITSPVTDGVGAGRGPMNMQDSRWKFQDDGQLPKPREFTAVSKRYRAGRVSSVPLVLSNYE